MRRIPSMIVCPYCQPGTISYAGVVLQVVCAECRAAIATATKLDVHHGPRGERPPEELGALDD